MALDGERLSTTQAVWADLKGHRRGGFGWVFEALLLFTMLFLLAILATLLVDVFLGGFAVLRDRGGDFLTSNMSSLASRAGVWQGIVGSLLMMVFVAVIAFPLGIGAAIYLEE